jgi:hypothetical protein
MFADHNQNKPMKLPKKFVSAELHLTLRRCQGVQADPHYISIFHQACSCFFDSLFLIIICQDKSQKKMFGLIPFYQQSINRQLLKAQNEDSYEGLK